MNTLAKISELKVFGVSPHRVFSDCAGKLLMEVPLNQITLNMALQERVLVNVVTVNFWTFAPVGPYSA